MSRLFERLRSGLFMPAARRAISAAFPDHSIEAKSLLTIGEQAELEELHHGLRELGIRPDEEVTDARRARRAFDLANESMQLIDRLFDNYTDGLGSVANRECSLLAELAQIALAAGLRWYQENRYMLTPEEWERLGRPAAIDTNGAPLGKMS